MLTINDKWKNYKKTVLHPEALPVQIKETKLAFFGGFMGAIETLREIGNIGSEEEENTVIDQIDAEICEFIKEVSK